MRCDSLRIRRSLIRVGFPSGQRGQTVNLLAMPSKVRILPPPPSLNQVAVISLMIKRGLMIAGVVQW